MYLKKLLIEDLNNQIIREIYFKKGLNIVLGVPIKDAGSNSLGKTTLMRSLNFCLGGEVDEFYTDLEERQVENTEIKQFLVSRKISFSLTLGWDINKNRSSDITITRKIVKLSEKNKLVVENFINEQIFSGKRSFLEELKKKIFKSSLDKPSFRQLIPKFLRRDTRETNNILRYLHQATPQSTYSIIWMFLFGFKDPELLNDKDQLERKYKKITKEYKLLSSLVPTGIKQRLSILEADLKAKINLRNDFKIDEKSTVDESKLNNLNHKVLILEHEVSDLIAKKSVFVARKKSLEEDSVHEDPDVIKGIYQELELFDVSSALQKKFEETIIFHNSMLEKEVVYVTDRIEKITKIINKKSESLVKAREEYNSYLKELGEQGALAKYTELNNEINDLTKDKAEVEALIKEQDKYKEHIGELESRREELDSKISHYKDDFERKIDVFNTQYFSPLTEKLYGEKWLVSFDSDSLAFGIDNIESNAGSGKKQNIVSVFDIAYMGYIQDEEVSLPYPRFATHDQVEVTDAKNLGMLKEFMDGVDGQFIFPIIYDKFEVLEETLEDDVILSLSGTDKFFKV